MPRKRVRSLVRSWEGRAHAELVSRRGGTDRGTLPAYCLEPRLRSLTGRSRSVLDVGCGTMERLSAVPAQIRVGVDAHRPYLTHRVADDLAVPVNYDARRMMEIFLPASFDLVMLIDVIEHFQKDEALEILDAVERIARSRVIVFTPRGEFPQAGFDAYGLGGEEFQEHRSSWEPADFEARGYSTVVFPGLHQPSTNVSHERAFGASGASTDAILAWRDS
jgi:SAM-dependent methyltransferase